MRRLLLYGLVAFIGLLGLRFYLLSTAPDLTPPPAMADAAASNPLPPCPESPNCARTTRVYAVDPDTLFKRAEAALRSTGAASVTVNPEKQRLYAVYRAFVFKDDVVVAVTPHDDGAAFHIRSASRVGYSDLGVNARRVAKILKALDAALAA